MKNFAIYTQYTAMWPQDIEAYQAAGKSCEDLLDRGFELITVKDTDDLDTEVRAICCEILDSYDVQYDCTVCADCGAYVSGSVCDECDSEELEPAPTAEEQIDAYTACITIELDPTNIEHATFIEVKSK